MTIAGPLRVAVDGSVCALEMRSNCIPQLHQCSRNIIDCTGNTYHQQQQLKRDTITHSTILCLQHAYVTITLAGHGPDHMQEEDPELAAAIAGEGL